MVLSLGSAKPMLAAIKRCASLVEFSLMTVNATWPGLMCFKPSLREINLQFGGKIEETRTMLHAAIPALRSASSKLERRSRCFPTPLVRNIFFATNAMDWLGEPRFSGVDYFLLRQINKRVLRSQSLFTQLALQRCYRTIGESRVRYAFAFTPRLMQGASASAIILSSRNCW